jgi:hypothetical protein
MDPPGRNLEADVGERALPRVNVQVVGVHEGAVDVEEDRRS